MSEPVSLERLGGTAAIVAANVRAETARKGWNQSDLARALGVVPKTVGRKWHGLREWGLSDLDDVAKVLGIPTQDLLRAWRDSNPQPSDLEFDAVVIPFPMRAAS